MLKRCSTCREAKELSEFHRCRSTNDGVHNVCKACKRAYEATRNPDHVRAIKLASHHRRKHLKQKVWPRKPYDEKESARRKLQDRVARGIIVRQPCTTCGKPNADAHHDDYSKPLDVRWFCRLCHEAEHRRLEGRA